ncbi:FAD-dependent oxidoreductase [bacterium]|nr:FAD-dependent oxidoreductase [bacterium]NIN92624.1 FAD-dependent oxidoreductase [bacterium]NIO18649.1 FAD-dependent oxidoreductase [bacterium]NIO73671.1 FAD-dependent oxidoreductase [bacterium]
MHYVIVGGSASGINAIEAIRSLDKEGKISLISDEEFSLYSRCLITYFLAGKLTEDKLKYRSSDFYEKQKVEALHGIKAKKVLPEKRKLLLDNGRELAYDRLLIATGASPKMVEVPGSDKEGILGLRTYQDAQLINERLDKVNTVSILGGGLIGLRAAYSLHARNKQVKVIVKSNQVLSQMLDSGAANFIRRKIEQKGIQVMTGLAAVEFLGGKEVSGLVLDDGRKLECELVIVGKGVRPNLELVKGTEIKTDYGIIVDDYLQTNFPNIYAAGDVAQGKDLISGQSTINALWPCAVAQGRVAGLNMAGKKLKYDGSMAMNSVEFFGLPVISMGITRPKDKEYEQLVREDEKNFVYKKVVLRKNRVQGMILVNKIEQAGVMGILMRKKVDVSSIKEMLLEDKFDFAKILPIIKEGKELFTEREFEESTISY